MTPTDAGVILLVAIVVASECQITIRRKKVVAKPKNSRWV